MAKKPARTQKKQSVKPEDSPYVKPQKPRESFWKANLFPALILFLLPFALYISSLGFEYVLDDKIVITDNQYTKKGFAGIWDIFTTESFQGYFGEQKNLLEGGRYRPLSIATFAIEYQFFGLNPKIGHLLNILFYALTGLLLFRILFMLIPPLKHNPWWLALPFLATLIFVAHPIHSEVVANVKGRDEILSLLGALGALYFSLQYLKAAKNHWLLLSAISFFLGLMSKESALTWIAVIPLTGWFFTKAKFSQLAKVTAPLVLTGVLYLVIRTKVIGFFLSTGAEVTNIMNNPFYGLSFGEKYATIFYTLLQYVKLLIIPHPLTHDYYPYQVPVLGWGSLWPWTSLALHLGLLYIALIGLQKKRIVSYAILFYFITLSIVSNIPFTVGATMNERFVYAPSLAVCLILAWLISRKLPEWFNEKKGEVNILSVGLLAILVIGYSAKTVLRTEDWRNAVTLNAAAVKYSPNSARANCFMGVALFEGKYRDETDPAIKYKMLDEITYYIERSLEIFPNYGDALTMHAGVVAEQYKRDQDLDKLLQKFEAILAKRTRLDYIDEYLEYLLPREDVDKLAKFLFKVGENYNARQRGDCKTALHYLNYAYQIRPRDAQLNLAIARCYQNLGEQTKAQDFFKVAYSLDPSLQ